MPYVDLEDGPQFPTIPFGDTSSISNNNEGVQSTNLNTSQLEPLRAPPSVVDVQSQSGPGHDDASRGATVYRGRKRAASTLYSSNRSVEEDTRSVALDLGLLSLNSDSRQVHYLGSSSGSLFASLLLAREKSEANTQSSQNQVSHNDPPFKADNRDASHLENVRKSSLNLFNLLQKVLLSNILFPNFTTVFIDFG